MSGIEITAGDWLVLLTHLRKWLSNLLRAGDKRKNESKKALRGVILAVRETETYVRHLHEGGEKLFASERDLSLHWTDLSFLLDDLKLNSLAKRCRIKGKYWANPSRFNQDFLDKAGTKLAEIEKIAYLALKQIDD